MNREDFLKVISRPLRESSVEVEGHVFKLKEMTESEGAKYELSLQDKKGNYDFSKSRRALLAMMLVDDDGNRLVESEAELANMPRAIAGVLFEAAQELNKYGKDDIEELVKNSSGADD